MSTTATKQDIIDSETRITKNISESFDDVTALLNTFILQVDTRFNDVESRVEKTQNDISKIFSHLDNILKKQEISDDERLVMGHQLERLDRWTHQLADKIGYKLTV